MTKFSQITADRRAQVFALLRHSSPEDVGPARPTYLDDATTALMIERAMSSFQAPPVQEKADAGSAPTSEHEDGALRKATSPSPA